MDLRVINSRTVPVPTVPVDIQAALLRVAEHRFLATFDLCNGFWQLPLSPLVQDTHGREYPSPFIFWGPNGAYQSTRVLPGAKNATSHLQHAMAVVFHDLLGKGLELYVDDIFIGARTFDDFVTTLDAFLERCREFNAFLKPSKRVLVAHEVRWVSHVISPDGVKRDPRNVSSILRMQPPTTTADLHRFSVWVTLFVMKFQIMLKQ